MNFLQSGYNRLASGSLLPLAGLASLALLTAVVVGRTRSVYPVQGRLTSEGAPVDSWSSRPDGCSTDPQDGLPPGKSSTVVSLHWYDVTTEDPRRNWKDWGTVQDVPLQLDLSQTPQGLIATLTTAKLVDPVVLEGSACQVLKLDTRPGPPMTAGAGDSLSGTLDMDCVSNEGRIHGHIVFKGCGR